MNFPHTLCPICNIEYTLIPYNIPNTITQYECDICYAKYIIHHKNNKKSFSRKNFNDNLIQWFDDGKCIVMADRVGTNEFRRVVMIGIWHPFDINQNSLDNIIKLYKIIKKKKNIVLQQDIDKLAILL